MNEYLQAAVYESIRRIEILKKRIPRPLPAPELAGVAERCNNALNECLNALNGIIQDKDFANPRYVAGHLREFRRVARTVSMIEEQGIPPLVRFSDDEEFLTRVVFGIHQEISFPLMPPIVACFGSNYFTIQPCTNVIFVPLIEGHCLLHLPDLVHEMAHLLIYELNDPVIEKIKIHYENCLQIIKSYYSERIKERKRSGPKGYIKLEYSLYYQWINNWIEEAFSDIFATFVLGPAYAWAHFHLTVKRSDNLYDFSHYSDLTHPSDDARMIMIINSLSLMKMEEETNRIMSKWRQIPKYLDQKEDSDYHLAYPEELIGLLVKEIHDGVIESKCRLFNPGIDKDSIVALLNKAWIRFWENPSGYSAWEDEQVNNWRKNLISTKRN